MPATGFSLRRRTMTDPARSFPELERALRQFFKLPAAERWAHLPGLLREIRRLAPSVGNAWWLPGQTNLGAAIQAVLPGELIRPGGAPVRPWAGGYTVVQLQADGTLTSAITNPMGAVYREYGPDLFA